MGRTTVMMFILTGLLVWVAVSCVVSPLVGRAMRRADLVERARSVEVLQARAQHPASHAA
jgi:hypothetical protein